MTAFVTVGTTCFPELVSCCLSADFHAILAAHQITHLIIQHGSTPIPPFTHSNNLLITTFDYKPNLVEYFQMATIVISHAGTGSILEALELSRPLLVVVNTSLMDNHQQELALELLKNDYLRMCKTLDFQNEFLQFMKHPPSGKWLPVDNLIFRNIIKQQLKY